MWPKSAFSNLKRSFVHLYAWSLFHRRQRAAKQGNRESQYTIACMYKCGFGVEQNIKEAARWYRKAADQGLAQAQYALGLMCVAAGSKEYDHHTLDFMCENRESDECDHRNAIDWYLKAAEQGHVGAQYELAEVIYDYYGDRDHDLVDAYNWYYEAAEQGHADAQYKCGMIIEEGKGFIEPDDEVAAIYYFKAARQGHTEAQRDLYNLAKKETAHAQYFVGYMYEKGIGCFEQSNEKAVRWYGREAEKSSYERAQYRLGLMYERGRGVDQNYKKSAYWYRKAAMQGSPVAQQALKSIKLRSMLDIREIFLFFDQFVFRPAFVRGLTILMASLLIFWGIKSIADADRLSRALALAEQNDARAQYRLGEMYRNGQHVKQNDAKAVHWFHKAAEQGYIIAQLSLGHMYENGRGVEQDHATAMRWYYKAARQDSLSELRFLLRGPFFRNAKKGDLEALNLLRKDAQRGDSWAQFNLGLLYKQGEGVKQDYTEAIRWFYKSADQDQAEAWYEIGAMFALGLGVGQDYNEAFDWYQKAAEQGDEQAKRLIEIVGETFLDPYKYSLDDRQMPIELLNDRDPVRDWR